MPCSVYHNFQVVVFSDFACTAKKERGGRNRVYWLVNDCFHKP